MKMTMRNVAVALLVPVAGLLLYFEGPDAKWMEIGRLSFAAGLLAACLVYVTER